MSASASTAAAERGAAGAGRFPPWGVLGVAVFAAGLWALAADEEGWNAIWYVPAWYGYLLILDAVIYARRGTSFVGGRMPALLRMMAWSVPFWLLFEAYNLRLHNWYYVFALRSPAASAVTTVLAFSTVIPACLFHAEALDTFGAFREKRCRPVAVTRRVLAVVAVVGALCAVAPLLWPRWTFWMVWGATFGIPEVVNYRAGAPSLLRDLEQGQCGRLFRLLAGGLWAGGVWELFNFWARTKWIYTVPGFEDWKLAEMPLAGFGGFPVLSLSAFALYSLVSRLRGPAFGVAVTAAAVGSAWVFLALLESTIHSRRPLLSELEGLDSGAVANLRAAGIPTPERLEREVRRRGIEDVARLSGVPPPVIDRATEHATLALHKGMGPAAASLLRDAGIDSVADLRAAHPPALALLLRRLAAKRGLPAPRLAQVRVWVRSARADGRPRR